MSGDLLLLRYRGRCRPLPPDDPLFEEGNYEREAAASMFMVHTQPVQTNLEEGTSSYQSLYETQQPYTCRVCYLSLPSSFLLELHVAEVHDSFFAAQVAQRRPVYQCLVEGCGKTFGSIMDRRKHLTAAHAFPSNFAFDRMHLHKKQGQHRPMIATKPETASSSRRLQGGCDMDVIDLATEGVANAQDAQHSAQAPSEATADSNNHQVLSSEAASRGPAAKGCNPQEAHQAGSRGKAKMQNQYCSRFASASGNAVENRSEGLEPDMQEVAAPTIMQKRAGRPNRRTQSTGDEGWAQVDVAMMDVDALTEQMALLSASQPVNRFQPNIRGRGRRVLL